MNERETCPYIDELLQQIETMIDERIAAALDEYSQIVPESAILAAGLLAEYEDEE